MSYLTYTTDALVCGAYNQNTADRTFRLFTKEAGMLYATAKSVREERSRQRYALQEFSQIRVSLVKGKNTWKIGSVEAYLNDYTRATSREARGSVAIVYRTLRRFIHGEEASAELFDFCQDILALLVTDISRRSLFELCAQVWILQKLGYLSREVLLVPNQEKKIIDIIESITEKQIKELQQLITTATLNSQL